MTIAALLKIFLSNTTTIDNLNHSILERKEFIMKRDSKSFLIKGEGLVVGRSTSDVLEVLMPV